MEVMSHKPAGPVQPDQSDRTAQPDKTTPRGGDAAGLSFAWERIDAALADGLEDLLVAHWAESAPNHDKLPLLIDWQTYRMEERAGRYQALSVRKNGRLVGYNAFFVAPSLHHRTAIFARNDVIYLDPAHRSFPTWRRMLEEPERRFAGKAFSIIYQPPVATRSSKPKRSVSLSDALTRAGYPMFETAHAKLL